MATYYWVGGTGTWDNSNTTNWSASSGGAGGSGPPNSADTVIFDSASGTGTCTTASGSACATATLNSSTLALTLGANHTMSDIFTLTLGNLSLGSFTLTCRVFNSSNTNVRSVAFGTGNITLTGNNTTIWVLPSATGFSYTGTPTVNVTYAGSTGTRTIQFGNTVAATENQVLNFNISAGTDSVSTSGQFKNLIFAGFSGTWVLNNRQIYGNLVVSSGMSLTAGTSITSFLATSGTQQITTNGKTLDFPVTQNSPGATVQLQDNLTMGSTRTFTLTAGTLDLNNRTLSTGIFSSSTSNVRTIAFGAGNITLTGNNATIWTTATATNLTVTGTPVVNATYAGGVGTRTLTMGNAGEANAIDVNVSNGTDTVILGTTNGTIKNLNFTGFSGTFTLTASPALFGDLTISPTMSFGAVGGGITFRKTGGTQNVTTAGKTFNCALVFSGSTGNVVFQDALTQEATRSFEVTDGTVRLKDGVTSTVGVFRTTVARPKTLRSTLAGTQATLSQASGTVNANDLTIRDINATGGATWNAFVDQNNIDAGNNDGWDFGISPVVGGAEYTYQLRSFTQPRRF